MNDSFKTAATTAVMLKVARFVGRYLATKPSGTVLNLLSDPARILGLKISAEDSALLGGGLAGLTVAEAIRRLFPQADPNVARWINIVIVLIASEYIEAVKERHGGSRTEALPQSPQGGGHPPYGRAIPATIRFSEMMGRALFSSNPAVVQAASNLFELIAGNGMTVRQYDQLEFCNTPAKFMMLASCTSVDELARILSTLITSDDRSLVHGLGHEVEMVFSSIGSVLKMLEPKEDDLRAAEMRHAVWMYAHERGTTLGEVFSAIGAVKLGLAHKRELTVAHIDQALAVDASTGLSPIAAFRKQQETLRLQRAEESAEQIAAARKKRGFWG